MPALWGADGGVPEGGNRNTGVGWYDTRSGWTCRYSMFSPLWFTSSRCGVTFTTTDIWNLPGALSMANPNSYSLERGDGRLPSVPPSPAPGSPGTSVVVESHRTDTEDLKPTRLMPTGADQED